MGAGAHLLRAGAPAEGTRAGGFTITPRGQLRDVARDLERQLYVRLYRETGGDFDTRAGRLLDGDDPSHGRKVRLRFNQLGLRVRDLDP